jgi:hypothetical protein
MNSNYQMTIAEFMYSVAKWIEDCFATTEHKMTSRMTATEIGQWVWDNLHLVLLEADATNWDGCFAWFLKGLEYLICFHWCPFKPHWFFHSSELLRSFLGFQAASKGVVVQSEHARQSGGFLTSTGNGAANIALTKFVFKSTVVGGCYNGDDNISSHSEEPSLSDAEQLYAALGFAIKLKVRRGWKELRYCSGWFYPCRGSLKWGVAPFRQLAKFGWNLRHRPRREWKGLILGMAISMLPVAGHVPIFGDFLRAIIRSAGDVLPIFLDDRQYTVNDVVIDEIDDDIVYFLDRYGFTLVQYLMLKQWADGVTLDSFPMILDHPLFFRGCQIDMEQEVEDTSSHREGWFESVERKGVDFAPFYEELIRYLVFLYSPVLAFGLSLVVGLIEHFSTGALMNPIAHMFFFLLQSRYGGTGVAWAMALHFCYNSIPGISACNLLHVFRNGLPRENVMPALTKYLDGFLEFLTRSSFYYYVICLPRTGVKGIWTAVDWEHWCSVLPGRLSGHKNSDRKVKKTRQVVKSVMRAEARGMFGKVMPKGSGLTIVSKARKGGNKRSKKGHKNITKYMLVHVNPFLQQCLGVRIPDDYNYPTAALMLRSAFQLANDTTYTTGVTLVLLPQAKYAYFAPVSGASGYTSGGTVSWSSANSGSVSDYSALSNAYSDYRVAGGGIRITCEQALTTATGHVWIVHFPAKGNSTNALSGYLGYPPINEGQCANMPIVQKFPLADLVAQPLIVPFKRISPASYWYTDIQSSGAYSTLPNQPGWCNIALYIVGAAGGAGALTLNVEHILHIEAMGSPSDSTLLSADLQTEPHRPTELIQVEEMSINAPVAEFEHNVDWVNVGAWIGRLTGVGQALWKMHKGIKAISGAGSNIALEELKWDMI